MPVVPPSTIPAFSSRDPLGGIERKRGETSQKRTTGISLGDHEHKLPASLIFSEQALLLSLPDEPRAFPGVKARGTRLSRADLRERPFGVKRRRAILSDLPSDAAVQHVL